METLSRKEEIEKKVEEIAESFRTARFFSRHPSDIAYSAAIEMAEWADQHPRKGLWDAEKVIGWLMNNINNYLIKDRDIDLIYEDLRKAMNESNN